MSEGLSIEPGHIQVLKAAPIFQDLAQEILEAVARSFTFRHYQVDEFLFLEGDPAKTYYLLYSGKVKILQSSYEGEQVILHILGSGDIVGALPTLGKGTYPGSARAMETDGVGLQVGENLISNG